MSGASQVMKKKSSFGNAKSPRKLFLYSFRALSMPGRPYQALPSSFLGDYHSSIRYAGTRTPKGLFSVSNGAPPQMFLGFPSSKSACGTSVEPNPDRSP
ncbi:hypothetical protein Chor_011997 [Crotalus horridus]